MKCEVCVKTKIMNSLQSDVFTNYSRLQSDLQNLIILTLKDNDVTDRDAGINLMKHVIDNSQTRFIEHMEYTMCEYCDQVTK